MWAIPILVGVLFAPESPWWLIRRERPEEARRSLPEGQDMSPVGGLCGAGVGVVFFPLARAKGPHVYGVGSVREEGGCTEVRVGADESERERVFWR